MKKSLLTIALMAVVSVTASAAAYQWSSTVVNFVGSDLKKDTAVSAFLVYLADGTLGSYTVDDMFTASSVGVNVSSDIDGTNKGGRTGASFSFTYGGEYGNGDSFALLLSYTNPTDGFTYWNLSSGVQTIEGVTDDDKAYIGPEFAFNSARGNDPTLTAGGGWVKAVPEPATGALALAGLALLFRRRRA